MNIEAAKPSETQLEEVIEPVDPQFDPVLGHFGGNRLQNILELDMPRSSAFISQQYDGSQGAVAGNLHQKRRFMLTLRKRFLQRIVAVVIVLLLLSNFCLVIVDFVTGGAVAVVIVVCVGFLLVLLVIGVLKMREGPYSERRRNRKNTVCS